MRKTHLTGLESHRAKILKDREETWHLRSRSIWLKDGDDNKIFFHNFSKGKRVSKTIWSMPIEEG